MKGRVIRGWGLLLLLFALEAVLVMRLGFAIDRLAVWNSGVPRNAKIIEVDCGTPGVRSRRWYGTVDVEVDGEHKEVQFLRGRCQHLHPGGSLTVLSLKGSKRAVSVDGDGISNDQLNLILVVGWTILLFVYVRRAVRRGIGSLLSSNSKQT